MLYLECTKRKSFPLLSLENVEEIERRVFIWSKEISSNQSFDPNSEIELLKLVDHRVRYGVLKKLWVTQMIPSYMSCYVMP